MTSLETLELMEARLTGKTLARLQELPRLAKLTIQTTDISAAEIEALRVALPRVTIVYRPLSEEDRTNTLVKKLAL